jgi:hypothetical protein
MIHARSIITIYKARARDKREAREKRDGDTATNGEAEMRRAGATAAPR